MNYNQALEKIRKGDLIKLPEWDGYWYMVGGKIYVITSSGETLDTPYLEDYKERVDWVVTDGARDLGGAIRAMKGGKKVYRKGWDGKGMYLWLLPKAVIHKSWIKDPLLLEAFDGKDEMECLGSIRMKTDTGSILTGWTPSQTDLLATDYYVMED